MAIPINQSVAELVTWVEAQDIQEKSFDKATWIPLSMSKHLVESGDPGQIGYRNEYHSFESIIVPLSLKHQFESTDWQSVGIRNPDRAWADAGRFFPPGSFRGDPQVLYSVLRRIFETGEPTQWDLLQELEVGLELFRRGDVWIRTDENDVEVAKLERDAQGKPTAVLFRAEHLRDYLCAKKAALLLTEFVVREAIEEEFPKVPWEGGRKERRFSGGNWEGICAPIHQGGQPFGAKMTMVRVWRENVDPGQDLPVMPDIGQDTGMKSESSIRCSTGRKLHSLHGRIWVKHWILPASRSPRIRDDVVEARVSFQVENQESGTLSGDALKNYRGWLWFRPAVVRHLAGQSKGCLKWYTEMTGEVGPAPNRAIHFGVNKVGLINVLGSEVAEMPEWAQRLWAAFNVAPEGGLSEELHMSQNLASPADTSAPEEFLLFNLRLLSERSTLAYGSSILRSVPTESDYFRLVHRFYADSFEDVCKLCKEITRVFVEQVDIGLLNTKVDPGNAATANSKKLGSLKRLALWLDTLGLNGRDVTRPLAGIYDLRIGDAHATGESLRESLDLFDIARDSQDFQAMCMTIIGLAADSVRQLANAVEMQFKATNAKP